MTDRQQHAPSVDVYTLRSRAKRVTPHLAGALNVLELIENRLAYWSAAAEGAAQGTLLWALAECARRDYETALATVMAEHPEVRS